MGAPALPARRAWAPSRVGSRLFWTSLADLLRSTRRRDPAGHGGDRASAARPNRVLPVENEGEAAYGCRAYDAVISTSSPALMARLAPDLPESYCCQPEGAQVDGRGGAGDRARPAVDRVLLAQPAQRGRLPVPGAWSSTPTSWTPEHYGGDHLIYCGDYLDPDHEYFNLSKEELLERFLPALERFNPTSTAVGSKTPGSGRRRMPSPCRRSTIRITSRLCARRCPVSTLPA